MAESTNVGEFGEADDRIVDEYRRRKLISPFVAGTVVTGPSLVIDKNGCAWWVRPDTMYMIRATPRDINPDGR